MALRIWLPLNGNLNNQGLSNVQITNTGATINNNGKIGKAYEFGPSHWLRLEKYAAEFLTYEEFSLSVWFKCTAQNTSHGGSALISAGNWNQPASLLNLALGEWNTDHYSRLIISGSGTWSAGYDYNFNLNTWYHVVLTSGNGKMRAYVNGTLIGDTYSAFTPASLEQDWVCVGNGTYYSGFIFNGLMNDVRIYDECLSPKQIKEISKGLVAHYKLDNPYVETTTNMAPGINGLTSYSTNSSPAWDTSLNGSVMYTPSNWSSGYNSGVSDPTHGYHAHWVFDETNKLIMIFPNLNSVINQKNRWLGISGTCSGTSDILAGEKYTISWWQKTDNLGLTASGGVYYKKTSSASSNFGDGCPIFGYNTKLNTWQFFSKTFTRASDYVQHSGGQSIYVYGNNGSEGTLYVKDVQIQKGDNATPYTVGTRNGQTYEEDCSGYGYNGIVSGSLKYNTDSARHSGSIYFNANCANYIYRPHLTFLTGPLTYNCWVYQVSATPATQFIMSQGRDNTCNGFNLSCANGIPKLWAGGNDKIQITGTTSIVDSKWHMLTGTWDGTTAKLYVDGTLIGSAAMGDITYTQSSGAFVIGKMSYSYTSTANYFPFNGSISDAKIYATALSADDILTMYKTSGIIDNKGNVYSYEFKEE